MKKYLAKLKYALFVGLLVYGCNSAPTDDSNDTPEVRTPVTVTSVSEVPLNEYLELNATSTFLQQNFVKSNLNGYIQKSNIKFGDRVRRGEVLFILKTKEASAIGNAVNKLDSSF
jgi:multidrug efflux pump subunit AcrA (membrane-fusion protein)